MAKLLKQAATDQTLTAISARNGGASNQSTNQQQPSRFHPYRPTAQTVRFTSQREKWSHSSRYNSIINYVPKLDQILFGGRLSHYFPTWFQITRDPWILDLIESGLQLEFKEAPW